MTQTVQANPETLVESVARHLPPSASEDFRLLMKTVILANLTSLSPGGNLLQIGGPSAGGSNAPVGVSHSVIGANGQYSVSISNPSSPQGNQIFHEVSYSPLKSFTQNPTTMPATTATNIQIPSPGTSFYFRIRSSFDKKTWSNYQSASSSPISAGLVGADATSAGGAFNQTNFAEVNSQASGATAAVTISGTGGLLTSYTAVKGDTQQVRPSATIVGVPASSEQFVGWDGDTFTLKPTLAAVLSDHLEPVGKVSVVSTSPPSVPTITPIISGGGVVGFNVTDGGAGASQPYTLTITGTGTGATAGQQTIVNGVLLSVAPGNAGSGYGGGTTVTASGGAGGGSQGGGTAVGGNGGRMSNV